MKVLLLTETLDKNRTSSGISVNQLINVFSELNYDFDVWVYEYLGFSADYPWLSSRVKPRIVKEYLPQRIAKSSFSNKVFLKIVSLPLIRILRSSNWFLNLLFNKKKIDEYDLVICYSLGNQFVVHEAISKLNFKVPIASYLHDPFPFSRYPEPYKSSVSFPKLERITDRFIEKSDFLISPSAKLLDHYSLYHNIENKIKYVIPHLWVDKEIKDNPAIIARFIQKGKVNIAHTGSLLGPRDLTFFYNALLKFKAEFPSEARFLNINLIGGAASNHKMILAKLKTLECVTVEENRMNYLDVLGILKNSDVLLLVEAVAETSPFMPGKLADYIGINKLIWHLGPVDSESIRILGADNCIQTNLDDEDAIFKTFLKLTRNLENNKKALFDYNKQKEYVSEKTVKDVLLKIEKELPSIRKVKQNKLALNVLSLS